MPTSRRPIIEKKKKVDLEMAQKVYPVEVQGLTKVYDKIAVVDKLSFNLQYGDCFALLGVTGAGKTTCFKILTGEI